RLKRLLELDRNSNPSPKLGEVDFAFSSQGLDGTGNDAAFSIYEAFSLALALEFLDSGFKPSDIISLLRRDRASIERRFNAIMKTPPPTTPANAEKFPDLPIYFSEGEEFADGRVFMLVPTLELEEVLPYYEPKKQPKAGPFPEVRFCRGIRELTSELSSM